MKNTILFALLYYPLLSIAAGEYSFNSDLSEDIRSIAERYADAPDLEKSYILSTKCAANALQVEAEGILDGDDKLIQRNDDVYTYFYVLTSKISEKLGHESDKHMIDIAQANLSYSRASKSSKSYNDLFLSDIQFCLGFYNFLQNSR